MRKHFSIVVCVAATLAACKSSDSAHDGSPVDITPGRASTPAVAKGEMKESKGAAPPTQAAKAAAAGYAAMGDVVRLDPALDKLIAPGAQLERLAEGFNWSEGPVWVKDGDYVLFSDVPENVIHKWSKKDGLSTWLKPSGYTGAIPKAGGKGSNGLTLNSAGEVVICQHGDRRIARMDGKGILRPVVERYEGKRFNSPNDACYKSNGDLYFTDPPYGLAGKDADPSKETPFNGVYRLAKNGELTLLVKELTFPNGIGFSPDEKTLYVNVSDPAKPVIMAYDVKKDGTVENGRLFFDCKPLQDAGGKGLPDGLKVDRKGNLFATAPGGVIVVSPEGKHLGTIATGQATGNCCWGEDGSVLYITADMYLCRIQTKTKGSHY